jgi:hypothetical protein
MIIRTLAALALLATGAWAQTEPPPETTPPATTEVAPAPATAVEPQAEAVAVAPVVPTDPMELAAFALANAREAAQCRFAFSRLTVGGAQFGWSAGTADIVARFDPRLPVGERWTVVRANSQQRAIQRNMSREDRKGMPSDLIGLMPEGEWTYQNIAVASEHPDKVVYSYTPRAIPERAANETGVRIIEQLVGQFEVLRETGRIISGTLTEPPEGAVRALGIVRVHRALFGFRYATAANGFLLTDSGAQQMRLSALGTPSEVEFSFRFEDVEPICDPAEVARIAAAEAAAVAARD